MVKLAINAKIRVFLHAPGDHITGVSACGNACTWSHVPSAVPGCDSGLALAQGTPGQEGNFS